MNNNWQKVKLSEIIQLIGGGTPKTTNNTYWNGNIPWLSVVDFNDDNRYVTTTEKTITELGLQNSTTHLLDKGDIIISARGTVGALAQLATPMAFNQSCYGIKATERSCNDFLYYLLKNSIGKLKKNTHGSVFNTITRDTFSNIVVSIPPLDEQRKIAGVLSALDDKIELNNKINRNLEAQAQAIFKSWFEKIENSKKVTLDYFCDIFTGKKNANAAVKNGKYKFFTCSPEILLTNTFIFDGPGIIISGNGSYTGRTRFFRGKFDLYQRTYVCTIKPIYQESYIYLLYLAVKTELEPKLMGGTHGSAIPYIVMNDIAKFELNYNEDVYLKLSKCLKPLVDNMLHNEIESQYLSILRNTLLPKLMSGEIDVTKITV